jgi:hypothetical protein
MDVSIAVADPPPEHLVGTSLRVQSCRTLGGRSHCVEVLHVSRTSFVGRYSNGVRQKFLYTDIQGECDVP